MKPINANYKAAEGTEMVVSFNTIDEAKRRCCELMEEEYQSYQIGGPNTGDRYQAYRYNNYQEAKALWFTFWLPEFVSARNSIYNKIAKPFRLLFHGEDKTELDALFPILNDFDKAIEWMHHNGS